MKKVISVLSVLFLVNSCEKNEKNINDPELITTLKLTFTDTISTASHSAVFKDPDGAGGAVPVQFDTIKLAPNTVYHVSILLLDESKAEIDTISNEVLEEGADHMFFFNSTTANVNFSYLDKDINNIPIGLKSRWATGAGSNGTVRVSLKHQPGVKNGTELPGETDVELVFQTRIQ